MWWKKTSAAADEAVLQARLRAANSEAVLMQKNTGIDIANDGEFGKPMRAATDRGAMSLRSVSVSSNALQLRIV